MPFPRRSPDDPHLDRLVRDLLAAGDLPASQPERLWGGPGSGATCTVCRAPIERGEVEIEFEDERHRRLRLHAPCFWAWDRRRRSTAPDREPAREESRT